VQSRQRWQRRGIHAVPHHQGDKLLAELTTINHNVVFDNEQTSRLNRVDNDKDNVVSDKEKEFMPSLTTKETNF
jgi:hypothetical protein